MKLDESFDQTETPRQWESLSTGGVLPSIPPTPEMIKDLGPLSDTPTMAPTLTQSELDLQAQEESVTEGQSLSPTQASLRRLGRDRRAMFSFAVIMLTLVFGYIGPLVYLHIGPVLHGGGLYANENVPPSVYHVFTHQEQLFTDQPSSVYYPLGTDGVGSDILARIMAGVTVSISVATLVILFDVVLGLIVGMLAGYYGGLIDTFLARFTDLMFAFPTLLFAILIAATLGGQFTTWLGPSGRLVLVSLALGVTVWPQMARYVRGQTLQLKEQQFIEAARASGASDVGILLRHIMPNLFNIVVTAATLDIVGVIITEAIISLLGLGVQPPGSSLGLMISDGANKLYTQYTEVIWPTVVLAIIVLALSFLGDGVQDAFNPRTKD
ncbi:MAG TPA: ABC transporter permease [Ktedonobacterales bacterium]|nr:ABC transporter permease [Ktedonobacterales bacterium]